jgi:UDP-N-acetylmuramate dehydrogenase
MVPWQSAVSLAPYTTWRAGGVATYFWQPQHLNELLDFFPKVPDLPWLVLGAGSNVLIRDRGFAGLVIRLYKTLNNLDFDGKNLRVEAGVPCPRLAKWTMQQGIGGFEFCAGIPGSVGGALRMNAGAYGQDFWQQVQAVEILDKEGLKKQPATAFQIGYRDVKPLQQTAPLFFVAAWFSLTPQPDTSALIQQRMKKQLQERAAKQPLGLPSCGSVFRNPPGQYAAVLIEQAGCKGWREGAAEVSSKHANFIINNGDSALAIETLLYRVQERVQADYGVYLQPEVHFLGEAA